MKHIMTCSECKIYTMKLECKSCSKKTVLAKPPKFSHNDKYQDYRRKVKREDLEKRNLL